MNGYVQELVEGKIDFEGQRMVEKIARVALVGATGVSFVLGYALQSMRVTVGTFGITTLAVALVVIPPWPWYNQHPVKWQTVGKGEKE